MNDTDKLELILEHARDYHDNREYKFFSSGFISYEIFDTPKGKSVFFGDIFISARYRGSDSLSKIIHFCESLEDSHGVKHAYCNVNKDNKYLKNIQDMYKRVGFEYHSEDSDCLYYELHK